MFLAKNNISNLSKNVFEGYKKLKRLHLTQNKLVILPNLHWIQHSLREIRAAGNKIKSLSVFETTGVFEMLEYIDMGRNHIRVFNVNLLHHMPKLRAILLQSNKLNHIDDFHFHYKKIINLTPLTKPHLFRCFCTQYNILSRLSMGSRLLIIAPQLIPGKNTFELTIIYLAILCIFYRVLWLVHSWG